MSSRLVSILRTWNQEFTRLKQGLALRLLSKRLFYIRAMLQGKPGEPIVLPIFAGETPVFHPFCLYDLKIYDRLTKICLIYCEIVGT
jgi:hypothetical protein